MKKTLLFSFAVACMFIVSSCCVTRMASDIKTKKPIVADLIADLYVRSEKATYTYNVSLKKHSDKHNAIEEMKENAVFELLRQANADVLVAPQFKVTKITCTSDIDYEIVVTGYPAYYTNFRHVAIAEKAELRELKEDAKYVIVKKTADNQDVEYKMVVPVNCHNHSIDLDDTTIDKVILNGKGNKKHCNKDKCMKNKDEESKGDSNIRMPRRTR